MTLNTTYEIVEGIVGTPANDIEHLILYLCASCLAVLLFYFVLYIFKLMTGFLKIWDSPGGGR